MAKNKYYAVAAGRVPGIYETWADCEAQVKGFPGALFKGFPDKKDAEAFLSVTADRKQQEELAGDPFAKEYDGDMLSSMWMAAITNRPTGTVTVFM